MQKMPSEPTNMRIMKSDCASTAASYNRKDTAASNTASYYTRSWYSA